MAKPYREMTALEREARTSRKWQELRRTILAANNTCWLCGRNNPPADTIDHVIPLKDGGTNDPANLKPAHGKKIPELGCPGNYGRGSSRPATASSREW